MVMLVYILIHIYFANAASNNNVKAAGINIIAETAVVDNDDNALYKIPGFQLFKNVCMQHVKLFFQPLKCSYNDFKMTT